MARKHWTQRSQARRPFGTAIRDGEGQTWQRGYGGQGAWRISDESSLGGESPHGGFGFLGFTDPKTGIRRGIFGAKKEYQEELQRLGFRRVKFNASIRERDVKRDYKFNQYTMKKGFMFNRAVYRLKK